MSLTQNSSNDRSLEHIFTRIERGVAHPLREHIEGHARADCMDPITMTQTFGALVWPVYNPGSVQHLFDPAKGGGARPVPYGGLPFRAFSASERLLKAMHHVQGIQCTGRDRNGAKDPFAAFFEGFKNDGLGGEIKTAGRESQGLGNPTAGVMQNQTEGAHLAGGVCGGIEERGAFLGAEIEVAALGIEQFHGCNPGLKQNFITTGSIREKRGVVKFERVGPVQPSRDGPLSCFSFPTARCSLDRGVVGD